MANGDTAAGGLPLRIGEAETKSANLDYQEARFIPRMSKLSRKDRDRILALISWEKIRDNVTLPLKNKIENELLKGTKELKDSTDAYKHRATTPPEWLINEAVSNYFGKVGK